MNICLLADLHLGIKKSDFTFQQSQMSFFKNQLVPELNKSNIKDIYILGDVFDTRQQINVQTINNVIDLFKNILNGFNIHIIVGNHDMYLTTDTGVNSLKILDLLPNVTVYENPTEITIDNKNILMLPWVTNYDSIENVLNKHYDYCFAHLDIIGFDMGGRLSETGTTAKILLNKIDHVYSGHYHNSIDRTYQKNKSITYVGSPYQLTRIDRDTIKGYRILNIATNEQSLIENNKSIKFIKHIYPNIDYNLIHNNVVDIDIPYEYSEQTKKIYDAVAKIEKLGPAYPPNLNYLPDDTNQDEIEIPDNLNIITLFQNYLDQLDTPVNKDKLNESFLELYNIYKGQE